MGVVGGEEEDRVSEFQHDQWVIREASRYWNGEGYALALRLTETRRQRQRENGAGELSSMRCPELGGMSCAALRRCRGTCSMGRAHIEEGR
jgi:hypothetical protein